MKALNRYIAHFGDEPNTESSIYTDEERISMLNKCVEKKYKYMGINWQRI